jgi:N-acetylglucosamine-6-phosphate deacetylase
MKDKVLRGLAPTGEGIEISISQGVITSIEKIEAAGDSPLPFIAPGFIDIQVNGFKGFDLNGAQPPSPQSVQQMVRSLWPTGVGKVCPTIITNSEEHIIQTLKSIVKACQEDEMIKACIPAVHLEGPFISPEDGPRGVHPAEQVRPPDWEEFLRWQDAAEGLIGIVTLSPEWPGATDFIERLDESGVVPAIGHTAASPKQIHDAVSSGAKLSTHLGNGSHLLLHRHENYIWDQLSQDSLWASLILDGHHLPPAIIKSFIRAKGPERIVLITDAMWQAGLAPGRYYTGRTQVELLPSGRLEVVGGGGILAGSALEMPVGISNAMKFGDLSLSQAIDLATAQPAKLLGLSSRIGVGETADLVEFSYTGPDNPIIIEKVYLKGEKVFSRE